MGCSVSKAYTNSSQSEDQNDNSPHKSASGSESELTENEIRIIKSTWHYMIEDLAGNGLQIFLKIFELCPDTKIIFNLENARHSELAKNEVIRAHGARFMKAINAAIYCLRDDNKENETIHEFLFKLGQQHKKAFEFKVEYFTVFNEALMWRWKFCIGDEFTKEVSDTWKHVFDYMLERVRQGYYS